MGIIPVSDRDMASDLLRTEEASAPDIIMQDQDSDPAPASETSTIIRIRSVPSGSGPRCTAVPVTMGARVASDVSFRFC